MSAKDKLLVPGAEQMINRHKEEIAEEFGIHSSPASRDVVVPRMKENTNKAKKDKTNEDM
ncbi:MAG TPA: small, acid-soluble spore protein, alpha/beta type [Bacillales bacterium]|nr:small, acid-soluble spore protein, alpha/beta type [Bacillales bacterium]